jgi:hypothetical protein
VQACHDGCEQGLIRLVIEGEMQAIYPLHVCEAAAHELFGEYAPLEFRSP